jgi:hypothetical protein
LPRTLQGVQRVVDEISELVQRAGGLALHGAFAAVQEFGCGCHVEVLEIPEYDDCALPAGQLGEGVEHSSVPLRRSHPELQAGSRIGCT